MSKFLFLVFKNLVQRNQDIICKILEKITDYVQPLLNESFKKKQKRI